VALLLGRFLLGVFGPEFVAGYDALRILLLGPIVCVGTWAVGLLASMTGYQVEKMVLLVLALVVDVVLNLLLIPRFGIEGAALASAVALASWQLAMVLVIGRRLGLDPTIASIRVLMVSRTPSVLKS
jgi:O-antigen/teichoic acid export membrane protein